MANFNQFDKVLKNVDKYLVLGKTTYFGNSYAIGQISIIANGQISNK